MLGINGPAELEPSIGYYVGRPEKEILPVVFVEIKIEVC